MHRKRKIIFGSLIIIFNLLISTFLNFTSFAEKDISINNINSTLKQEKLCIIFSHDIHSNLNGLAKAKTVINQVKEIYPHPLILDGGDFSMGTLYQTVFQESASELKMLGALDYDITTIGNHEFDYTGIGFANMLNAAKNSSKILPSIVISNIDWEKSLSNASASKEASKIKKAMDNYGVKDYQIIKKNGLKIAVFGILGKEAISYSPTSNLIFEDPIKCSNRIVKEIKNNENVDMIVCLSHSGTNENPKESEDEILAKKVPDIDVIISAHTHTKLEQPIIIGNTVIASCGKCSHNLGVMEFTLNKGKVNLDNYELICLNGNISSDKTILGELEKIKKQVQKSYLEQFDYKFDQVLAYNPYEFTPYVSFAERQQEYPLGNIIADSYIYAVKKAEGENYKKIDVSIVPSGVIRASLNKGNITVSDVFNVSSLGIGKDGVIGYPLISCYLTGKDLKNTAEIDASIPSFMPESQLFMNGLAYTFNPNRLILNKVVKAALEPENGIYKEIEDDKLYRVVTGLYTTQMLTFLDEKSKGLISVIPRDKNGKPIENYEDHIIYTKNGELKEWVALASYLESFPKENGIPVIPEYYSKTHGRKIICEEDSIIALIKKPNKIFLALVVITTLLLCFMAISITAISRKIRSKS
ncbi:bifunctional metallophosphatase/5'-nucleotidase [Anaerovorax odorimutans]|uniref:bifunctional metallophosphatase/5'-nucleotidase n=1 Tax=Anaerovorax odorimutans TaxID=109327 RepID=UPI00041ABE9C|nr:5'-nucleotidase C-terminal domain-containing protein [Anaerovorax odorimutans]